MCMRTLVTRHSTLTRLAQKFEIVMPAENGDRKLEFGG